MAQMREYKIVFRNGKSGELQEETYTSLSARKIKSTRYADEHYLYALGIQDNVNYMLDVLNLNYFLSLKDPVSAQQTLEFLSSLIFSPSSNTNCSSGIV